MWKVVCLLLVVISLAGEMAAATDIETKSVSSPDGVKIVYSAAGTGEVSLVFVHGGLANRTFYDEQLKKLAGKYRVVALDLAGHGGSGSNRKQWGMKQFAADVKAVVDAEKSKRVVLLGNSLGGPVVVEAALLLKDRVIGVVGIDTFQRIPASFTDEEAKELTKPFEGDYRSAVHSMVKRLFHADADPEMMKDAERRMQSTPANVARSIFLSLAGYQPAAAARKLTVPLRAINGDLFPTYTESVKEIRSDFEVVVMEKIGHYPMLERPAEFNRHVVDVVEKLAGKSK